MCRSYFSKNLKLTIYHGKIMYIFKFCTLKPKVDTFSNVICVSGGLGEQIIEMNHYSKDSSRIKSLDRQIGSCISHKGLPAPALVSWRPELLSRRSNYRMKKPHGEALKLHTERGIQLSQDFQSPLPKQTRSIIS